jgi:hypothetical protein
MPKDLKTIATTSTKRASAASANRDEIMGLAKHGDPS